MKILQSLTLALAVSLAATQVQAQAEAPKGFTKGTIVLADNTSLTGFIKESIDKNASLQFIPEAGGKKKTYSGSDLASAQVEGVNYLCISGDFFKVITNGELAFLQKASDASGKLTYNGAEAVVSNGTEGKPGDYFIFTTAKRDLKLVSKKNFDEVIAASFAGNQAAIDKAKTASQDISQLKEAVVLYNNKGK